MLSSTRLGGRFFELLRRKRCLKLLDDVAGGGGGARGSRSLDELPLVEATLPPPPPPPTPPPPAPALPMVELSEPPNEERSDRFRLWL